MEVPFLSGLSKFKVDIAKFRKDDDYADRFSHFITTIILVCFSIIVSTRQYIGKPIACWVPTEFTGAQEEYAESFCWVSSTYFISPYQNTIPELIKHRENRKLLYYQWVPFILMLQAIMFNLPCIIWRVLNWQSGINLSSLIDVASEIETTKEFECRKNNISFIARHIDDSLRIRKEYRSGCNINCRHFLAENCCFWFGRRYGNYLVFVYAICKSLYLLNVIGQLFLMNRFLGSDYTFYGIDLIYQLASGQEWKESGNFPRVTLCDFVIRKLANQHRYTVQCVLSVNMFNEKIFIFLWFWYVIVAMITLYSFAQWSFKSMCRIQRFKFIKKFLVLREVLREPGDRKKIQPFIDLFLQQDGIFTLRLLSVNCGQLVTAEVTEALWYRFKEVAKYDPDEKFNMNHKRNTGSPPVKRQLYSKSNSSCASVPSNPSAPVRPPKRSESRNLHNVNEDPGEFV